MLDLQTRIFIKVNLDSQLFFSYIFCECKELVAIYGLLVFYYADNFVILRLAAQIAQLRAVQLKIIRLALLKELIGFEVNHLLLRHDE